MNSYSEPIGLNRKRQRVVSDSLPLLIHIEYLMAEYCYFHIGSLSQPSKNPHLIGFTDGYFTNKAFRFSFT